MEEDDDFLQHNKNYTKSTSRISLPHFCREIFKDDGEVNRSTGTDTIGVLSGLEKTRDTANGKARNNNDGKARNNNNEWKNRWSGSRDRTNLVEELMELNKFVFGAMEKKRRCSGGDCFPAPQSRSPFSGATDSSLWRARFCFRVLKDSFLSLWRFPSLLGFAGFFVSG
ncbi:hypothetical protein P8452_09495 [Trifolium repens]|nr:hypothetical protein P8452_09495 [Trifolium repens]